MYFSLDIQSFVQWILPSFICIPRLRAGGFWRYLGIMNNVRQLGQAYILLMMRYEDIQMPFLMHKISLLYTYPFLIVDVL
jgi:hypothetical protein